MRPVIRGHIEFAFGTPIAGGVGGRGTGGIFGMGGAAITGGGGGGGAINGFGIGGGVATCPPGGGVGAPEVGRSMAFSWLRFTNIVNSLGPLGMSSTGGASIPGLKTFVVLEAGRFMNVAFDSGTRAEGVDRSSSRAGMGDAGEGGAPETGVRGAAAGGVLIGSGNGG